jgi:hypothetical protein
MQPDRSETIPAQIRNLPNMKTTTLITALGTFGLTAAAVAAPTPTFSVTTSNSTWATAVTSAPLSVNYVDPGSIANTTGSGNTWTGGQGWEVFTLTTVATSGAVSLTGSSPAVAEIDIAGSSTFAYTQFQFDFIGSEQIWGPQGTNGIYGVIFNMTFSPDTSGVSVSINGGNFMTVTTPNTGFIGVYADQVGTRIDTVAFALSSNQSVEITGFTVAVIPAPGAMALLGVAGLVGSRRRR